ncbi:MAG: hypothetical protein K2Y71_29455 [Xanthobacteraceae bacterium]|nr:hypothetical protein [Xanthobacteraceae bacterium]
MITLTELENLLASSATRDPAELLEEISQIGDTIGEDASYALLASHPGLLKYGPALTQANRQRVHKKETEETERMLQLRSDGRVVFGELLSKPARRAYDRVSDLFQKIDFDDCRRLVMVGCGPSPVSVFQVHDKTEIPEIIALDVVPDAIEKVRALIDHFGLSRMSAKVCDGREFDYDGAGIVIVANMVSPKAGVVSRIADTAPAAVQIAVRDPYGLGLLWADSAERALDPRLEVIGRGHPGLPLSRDVFIKRRTRKS